MDHLPEIARWANATLACASAAVMIATVMRRWEQLTPRIRRIGCWVVVLLIVAAYGSGEAAAESAPVGARVALGMVSLTGLLASMLYRFHDDA